MGNEREMIPNNYILDNTLEHGGKEPCSQEGEAPAVPANSLDSSQCLRCRNHRFFHNYHNVASEMLDEIVEDNEEDIEAARHEQHVHVYKKSTNPITSRQTNLMRMLLRGTPKVVLIDMDNTLVDWEENFHILMQKHHPSIPLKRPNERLMYDIEKNYDEQYWNAILDLNELEGFWRMMPAAPGAVEAVRSMSNEFNLEVFIVTAPDTTHTARCAEEKFQWIEQNLGPEWKARTVLCTDKTIVRGDILIDDKPSVCVGIMKPSWTHVVFCQPYNLTIQNSNQPALCRWNEWKQVLLPILTEKTAHVRSESDNVA